jgi:hypothetical protein
MEPAIPPRNNGRIQPPGAAGAAEQPAGWCLIGDETCSARRQVLFYALSFLLVPCGEAAWTPGKIKALTP